METAIDYITGNKFEVGMLAILLLSSAHAATFGLTPGLLGKLGFFVGVYLALFHGGPFEEIVMRFGVNPEISQYASPIVLVALCTFSGWALSVSINAVLTRLHLEFLSHVMGLCYGVARGAVLVLLLVFAASKFGVLEKEQFESSLLLRGSGDILVSLGQSERTPRLLRDQLYDFDYNASGLPGKPATADQADHALDSFGVIKAEEMVEKRNQHLESILQEDNR